MLTVLPTVVFALPEVLEDGKLLSENLEAVTTSLVATLRVGVWVVFLPVVVVFLLIFLPVPPLLAVLLRAFVFLFIELKLLLLDAVEALRT